ncbi:MAG: transglutaminase [Epsilonproteobacteria bacterium]|nr:transglutaminase [Campylobacterota bacterium]
MGKKSLFLFFGFILIVIATVIFASNDDFFIDKATIKRVEKKYGYFAKNRVLALVKMMNSVKYASDYTKLQKVNNFFNRVPYQSDWKTWGVKDYWATRLEFLGKDRGDCEDYAIAKYFTLKQLGISENKMYLTYVKVKKLKIAHMVLTYFKTKRSVPLVLDNYNKKILPATQRRDLIPIYSFNAKSLFLSKQRGLGKEVPQAFSRNKKWIQLLNDIKRNKI